MGKVTFEALMKDLKAGKYAPVYLLHGTESYFIDEVTDYIQKNALAESEKVFNQVVCYGKEVDSRTIIDNARQYPMMAQKRVVILKEANAMRDLTSLETYVTHPSPSTILVIAHPHKKVDGRTGFSKAVTKHGVVFESAEVRDYQMSKWVTGYLSKRKYTIAPDALQILIDYLGTDLGKVANEINKLQITLGERRNIERDDVLENIGISKEYNIFEFQKAMGQRDIIGIQKMVQFFTANMKNTPMVMITALLYSYFSKLLIIRSMGRRPEKEIMTAIGLHVPYFFKEYKEAAGNFSLKHLEQIVGILNKYDLRSKGVGNRGTDEAELLREMVQEIYTLPERVR